MSATDPKVSHLYREASAEGPPAALDAAILAAARKRLAQPQRPARSSWVRWMAPASALATLVVAVSLAFLLEREQPVRDTGVHPPAPRPQGAPPARAPEPAPAAALPAPAPRPAPPPADAAAPKAEAFPGENRAKATESTMSAPKAPKESDVRGDSALGGARTAAPAAAGKVAPLRQQTIQSSPEAWLEEIIRLKREGREQEAAEQLAELRKAYPAFAVPENLLPK